MALSRSDAQMLLQGLQSLAQTARRNQRRRLMREAGQAIQSPGGADFNQLWEIAQQDQTPMRFMQSLAPAQKARQREIMQDAGSTLAEMYDDGKFDPDELQRVMEKYNLDQLQVTKLAKAVKQTIDGARAKAYTLGPGEVRYRGKKPIAKGPARQPDRETVRLYSDKMGRSVKVKRGTPAYERFIGAGYAEGKPETWGEKSAKEREIQRYLNSNIVDTRQEAIKLAEGQYKLQEGPFGVELWDKTRGEMVKRSGVGPEGTYEDEASTNLNASTTVTDIEKVFGPISGIKQFANNIFGWALPGQIFPDTERARHNVKILNQRLTPFFQVSERGAQWDMDRIDEILFKPQFFKDPDIARDKIKNLNNMIETTIENKRQIMNNENLSAEQIEQFANDIGKLRTAKSLMPEPENFSREKQEIYITIQDIKNMSANELQNLNIDNLNQQQARAVLDRIKQLEQGK